MKKKTGNKLAEDGLELVKQIQGRLFPVNSQSNEMGDYLRPAAILVPLFLDQGIWKLLYIRRSNIGEFHRGEVAFPGGGKEITDQNMADTALRETREELGILPENIHILGEMEPIETVSKYFVTPIVAFLTLPANIKPDPIEVDRVFSIPLNWLMDNTNWQLSTFEIAGRGKVSAIVYNIFDNEKLWGFTARVTLNLIDLIKKEER